MHVQSAIEELERLEHAFDHVKAQLLDRLHDVVRKQLFHNAPPIDSHMHLLPLESTPHHVHEGGHGAKERSSENESNEWVTQDGLAASSVQQ